jgi:hypothetical protein
MITAQKTRKNILNTFSQEFIFFRQTQQTYKDNYLLTLLLKIKNWLHVSAFLLCGTHTVIAYEHIPFMLFCLGLKMAEMPKHVANF